MPLLGMLQDTLGASTGVRETLRLVDAPEPWVIVLVLLPAAALVAWIGYLRTGLGPALRVLLGGLRFASILLLLLVLFRPVFVQRNEEIKRAEVLVLVDDSASMWRKDAYAGDTGVRELARSLGLRSASESSRLDLATALLRKELLPLLEARDYQVRLLRFAEDVAHITDLATLEGRGRGTNLGDALGWSLAAHRGRHLTDVLVLSDGRSNGGGSPLDAARAAAAAGIPVHSVVIGDTRPERNLLVEIVELPPEVLEGDEVSITVRVIGRGMRGESSAQVSLEELSERGPGRVLDEQSVRPGEGGQRVVFVAPPAPPEHGRSERRFRVAVAPLPEETLLDDNALEFSVHITPEKIRVLYVDGYPRWEYRFLKELLKRADKNITAQMYLLSATPDFLQESTLGTPPLARVPTSREELLEGYDVVILGDVRLGDVSHDPARIAEFASSLREFVESGGGLFFQAGELDNPRFYADTPLEALLPVVLDPTAPAPSRAGASTEWRPLLEDPATPHAIVRLHPDLELNRRLWEDEDGLRGFFWHYPAQRAKPGTHVLLRHPREEGPWGRHPLLVAGYYPAGRTLFLGVDSTWRWRYQFGDRYHERFWRNAIRWLALGRLKSADRRSRLDSLQSRYDLDERVTLEARILDQDFRPSERPGQAVQVGGPEGDQRQVELALVPGRDGLYRGSFEVGRPGLYRAWIEAEGKRVAAAEFEVSLPSRENADPTPDPATLGALASMTGGSSVGLAGWAELRAQFPGGEERREAISSRLLDAWDHWGTLLAALGLLSIEWILRKRLELV